MMMNEMLLKQNSWRIDEIDRFCKLENINSDYLRNEIANFKRQKAQRIIHKIPGIFNLQDKNEPVDEGSTKHFMNSA